MKVAVVAGVGPGLGASLARAFSREGYALALLSRTAQSSEPVANELRANEGKVLALAVDVTDRQAVVRATAKIPAEMGPVTVLAYNAGGFLDLDPEIIRRSFEVGTMGAVHLAQAAIPD